MNILALALASVLAAQTPPPPPPKSEVETLRAELEKKNAQILDLQKRLDQLLKKPEEKMPGDWSLFESNRLALAAAAQAQALETERAKALDALARKAREPGGNVAPKALVPTTPTPTTGYLHFTYQGKVTAVANEVGLIVISIGLDDGVAVGQEFSILREGAEIGTVTIDRVDHKWSTGKVSQKKNDPRVGDEILLKRAVYQQLFGGKVYGIPAPATAPVVVTPGSAEELRALRKELDEVRSQVRQLSDRIVPSFQGPGVSVDETPEELRAHLGILRGLLVRQVREGSPAERAGLKVNDVVPDLLEAQLLEAIGSGMPIHVFRKGQRVRLPGAKEK